MKAIRKTKSIGRVLLFGLMASILATTFIFLIEQSIGSVKLFFGAVLLTSIAGLILPFTRRKI